MTRRNLTALATGLVIFSILLVLIERSLVSGQLAESFQSSEIQRAAAVSRVNLMVLQAETSQRQGLSSLLQQLDSLNELSGWQLLDSENEIISQKPMSKNAPATPQDLFFYLDGKQSQLMTLRLYFKPEPVSPGFFSVAELLLIVVTSIVLASALFLALSPWVRMEKYARYLIDSNQEPKRMALSQISNPVYQVINQLLLKNSLLTRDKSDLTDQIRKISYVDEVTELGNQLFFKAEFEVRLHNHEEDESGLLVLLSFNDESVLNGDIEEQVLNDEILHSIALLLKNFIRDIPHALVARLRSNDFALLLPNQTRDKTDQICKKLIQQLDKSIFDNTPIREHFVDIGISAYKQGFDYSKIIAEADMALRNSQLQGGNSWFMYGEVLADSKVRGLMRWRGFLERILDSRQLQLYGQQIHWFIDEPKTVYESPG